MSNHESILSKRKIVIAIYISIFVFSSCKKFIDIDPPKTEIISEYVFTSDASVKSAIRGLYSRMMTNQSFINGDLELYTGLSSDELENYSFADDQIQFYTNSIATRNSIVLNSFWREAYLYISNANAILEGLADSKSLSPTVKNQVKGEVIFIRAFCHFFLANIFGDIPYVTTTDYGITSVLARIPKTEVYNRIIQDLINAQDLMADSYSYSNNERNQPNKSAAQALLARIYLYSNMWADAESEATKVINKSSTYTLLNDLNDVFLANSLEAIWQLTPVEPGVNTKQGQYFILNIEPENNSFGNVALTSQIYNSFEIGDRRFTNWVGSFTNGSNTWYYSNKYKVGVSNSVTEYSMVLRLAELYLIRAEARARQNNTSGAQSDLNIIRIRAGLSSTSASDQASLLAAIFQERKVELFTEGGHRWFDLKRLDQANSVLGPIKGPEWQITDQLYPIPESERILNPNLTQNPGY